MGAWRSSQAPTCHPSPLGQTDVSRLIGLRRMTGSQSSFRRVSLLSIWDAEAAFLIPGLLGEFLVFGSHLAHRSGPNKSDVGRAAIYATYNTESDGGDMHDAYYADRRVLWPATFERVKGEKYEEVCPAIWHIPAMKFHSQHTILGSCAVWVWITHAHH